MPIYEYQCEACGHQLEAFQKFSDAPLTECSECHKPTLNKLISASGFQLKGSGWYATDYQGKAKPKVAATDKGADEGGSGDTSGTETKSNDSTSNNTSSNNSTVVSS